MEKGEDDGMMLLEGRHHRLSLAICFEDAYTKAQPIGQIDVYLMGFNKKAIKNPSQFHLFLDLPIGSYVAQVRSENYFGESIGFEVKEPPKIEDCMREISLKPRPSYPFPSGETLVRGTLKKNGEPSPNADISGKIADESKLREGSRDFSGRTDEQGEFVLFFGALADYNTVDIKHDMDIKPKSYVKIVTGGDGRNIRIKIDEKTNEEINETINDIEVGRINSRNINIKDNN